MVYHFTSNTKITVVHITKRTFVSSWPARAPKIPQMLVSTNKDCPQRRASGCGKGWTQGRGEGSACRPPRRSGWHERKGGWRWPTRWGGQQKWLLWLISEKVSDHASNVCLSGPVEAVPETAGGLCQSLMVCHLLTEPVSEWQKWPEQPVLIISYALGSKK